PEVAGVAVRGAGVDAQGNRDVVAGGEVGDHVEAWPEAAPFGVEAERGGPLGRIGEVGDRARARGADGPIARRERRAQLQLRLVVLVHDRRARRAGVEALGVVHVSRALARAALHPRFREEAVVLALALEERAEIV